LQHFGDLDVVFYHHSVDLSSAYHPNLGQELEKNEFRQE
jgi:hypothetical protein